jgi:hypothetical protein
MNLGVSGFSFQRRNLETCVVKKNSRIKMHSRCFGIMGGSKAELGYVFLCLKL